MDEKVLLDWKEVHADIYSKFKQDLEAQLQKPYHETILELGDNEDVDSLQQAMTSLASVTSQGNLDIGQLYAKAVEQNDEVALTSEERPFVHSYTLNHFHNGEHCMVRIIFPSPNI